MARVFIAGATGTVGKKAVRAVELTKHQLCGISYWKNKKQGQRSAESHGCLAYRPSTALSPDFKDESAVLLKTRAQFVINAVSGIAGIAWSMAAVSLGLKLILANKESIAVAGPLLLKLARSSGATIVSVDSEHAAIAELYRSHTVKPSEIIITASGGPFLRRPDINLKLVTPAQAAAHPRWKMGSVISIASACILNKCIEVIEAAHLFETSAISVVVHPEAIVHGMIRFQDNSVHALLSQSDMLLPLVQALCEPASRPATIKPLSFDTLTCTFFKLEDDFKPISKIMKKLLQRLDSQFPAAFTIAAECAIKQFVSGKITFDQIVDATFKVAERFKGPVIASYEDVIDLYDRVRGIFEQR